LRDNRPCAGECHSHLDALVQTVLKLLALLPAARGHGADPELRAAAEAVATVLKRMGVKVSG
jgi:hypothetical protein